MEEVYSSFVDVDGNFAREFQTTGFDARVWELYLHALFSEWGLERDVSFSAPDFVLPIDQDRRLCVEAVTVNPSRDAARDAYSQPDFSTYASFSDQVVIGLGSALYSKMKKKYWTQPHVADSPLAFAIENFSSSHSLVVSSSPLATYLYGMRYVPFHTADGELTISPVKAAGHQFRSKTIPSGFFFQREAEHISAVMFSNSATVAKFNRIGQQGQYCDPGLRIFRLGTCHNHNSNASLPLKFQYEVGDPSYHETWSEGFEVFLNPRARLSLKDTQWNPFVATHELREDSLVLSTLPEFHPYASLTFISRR